ncbi:NAD(P)H-dependent oxidoreductase [Amycolatopsis sp. NPDC049252]|uniref:NAD(P)H-dependent oxidoreductase n=1 Tax=Amycolatopsis sp. NPDC049252 TaxID=3363933 RepID=UPI00371D519C
MTQTPSAPRARKTAMVVHAHPEPNSFCSAQMRTAIAALQCSGYDARLFDLYQDHWPPALGPDEFGHQDGHFKPQSAQMIAASEGTLAPEVHEHLDTLLHADLLVLSFPLWWFSVPAILKGWIDRVFIMGSVFGGGKYGYFDEAALAGRRAVLLVTTGGSAESFSPSTGAGNLPALLFHIDHGLRFVGYDVLEPVVTWGPVRQSEAERSASLAAVQAAFEQVDNRPIAPFDPI